MLVDDVPSLGHDTKMQTCIETTTIRKDIWREIKPSESVPPPALDNTTDDEDAPLTFSRALNKRKRGAMGACAKVSAAVPLKKTTCRRVVKPSKWVVTPYTEGKKKKEKDNIGDKSIVEVAGEEEEQVQKKVRAVVDGVGFEQGRGSSWPARVWVAADERVRSWGSELGAVPAGLAVGRRQKLKVARRAAAGSWGVLVALKGRMAVSSAEAEGCLWAPPARWSWLSGGQGLWEEAGGMRWLEASSSTVKSRAAWRGEDRDGGCGRGRCRRQ
ncbi:uncharacterized protein A4U43_C03F27650 [Asparagus officinalis]|uniref:Uncharacterized protein n=1 Tax=Asparagus officinalis TaxID=4686 RepID=A0A5P1FE82_ASPOF|nr:uncharacterized protein A4U43_C03F27650 [Asparagus officinalis]